MVIDFLNIPGAKETADSDVQESSPAESLTQKFLKASHNMVNITHLTWYLKKAEMEKVRQSQWMFFS